MEVDEVPARPFAAGEIGDDRAHRLRDRVDGPHHHVAPACSVQRSGASEGFRFKNNARNEQVSITGLRRAPEV